MAEEKKQNYSVPNLERAMLIIEHLVMFPGGLRITEISEQLGYPKNSVFRILKTLKYHGYLSESDNVYCVSSKFLAIGYKALGEVNLIEKSLDIMREIRNETNETIILGKLLGKQGVVLEEVPSQQPVKFMIDVGHHFALHTSAAAKAIMAYLPETEIDYLLSTMDFIVYTDNTLKNTDEFRAELVETRETGFAYDRGERFTELHCVGAPIFNYRNYPVAAIWVSGPSYRLKVRELRKAGEILKLHAMKISKRLGYEPDITG
jgi:DNA-binding IclR family transcriptional regulator